MATAVNYSIKGKCDSKAIKEALAGFKSLQSSVGKINNLISGFVGAKIFQTIKTVATETKDIFSNQNEALVKFNTAVSKTNLNISKLQQIQSKVSRNNFFDGDSINNAMQYAAQMGLTEEQIEKVMSAATEMAASGIMPLDNAVKALSVSYSGNVAQLKKIAPELSNLTDKEIKNGAAVDIMLEKYNGFADAMSSTFSGRNTQWKNSIDDLKASIGSIPTALSFITEGKLLEPLNKVTEWIVSNRDYIINFFLHLPDIAKVAFKTIQEGFKQLFSVDGLKSIVTAITNSVTNVSTATLKIFAELIKGVIDMIKEFCSNLDGGTIGDLLINAWYKVCNQLNEMFFKVFDVAIELISGNGIGSAIDVAMGKKAGKIAGSLHYDYKPVDTTEAVKAVSKVVTDMGKNITGIAKDLAKDQKDVVIEFLGQFEGIGEEAFNEVKEILAKDLPEDLKKALEGVTYSGATGGTTTTGGGGGGSDDQNKSVFDSLGQLGKYIQLEIEGGAIAILVQFVGDVIKKVSAASDVVNNILNIVDYFIDGFVTPLIQILEPVLIPFLHGVKSMASVVASVLPLIMPTVNIISGTLEVISKILFWVRTFFVSLFDTIVYGFNAVENWIIKIYNAINGWLRDLDYKNYSKSWGDISEEWASLVDYDKFNDAYNSFMGVSSSGSSSSGSSGASYTAAKDVYVTINYNNSFVNGDAREIAIQIRNEIATAERLGY